MHVRSVFYFSLHFNSLLLGYYSGFTFSQLEMSTFSLFILLVQYQLLMHILEVVLSELLTNFAFELSDKPVVWNLAGVSYPSISTESTKGELWLKVRKLSED